MNYHIIITIFTPLQCVHGLGRYFCDRLDDGKIEINPVLMDDKDKKIVSLKNVLQKLKTKVTKQEENLRLMKLQKLNETRKKWRNFKTFEMHINKRKHQTSVQENESTKSLVSRLTLCEALNEEVFSEEQIKYLFGKCLFQATVTSLALKYHLSYMVDESQDDKIKRVDSIKVTFMNPFHHSELDRWISQCYRNNDLKCIVQGISKYSQLYILRDAIIEKVMSIYGQFFTFILSEEKHCCLVKCENLQLGLTYFVGEWKIEGSTCSDSMKHDFIFELLPNGTSLDVHFRNTLMELCKKDNWELYTLKKLWLKLGQMIVDDADKISSGQHSPSC